MSQITVVGPQTAAVWADLNTILGRYELGVEIDPATHRLGKCKLGDGETAWNDLAYLTDAGGPKVYRALLTQTGTDAPVATVLENTLGGTPALARAAAGAYTATLEGAFTANKTLVHIIYGGNPGDASLDGINVGWGWGTADSINLLGWDIAGQPADWNSSDISIEILVYP